MTRSLRRIVDRLGAEGLLAPGATVAADAIGDVAISGITADSREAGRGTLFCAIRGTASDGHAFLGDAAAAGAPAALVEEVDAGAAIPQIRVTDGRLATAIAAAEFYGDPWREMALIGVTGTNGKTTTAAILRHLLSMRGGAASIGTLGLIGADGKVVPGTEGLTTPGPVQLARLLREMADAKVQAVAMEVSSHALDQGRAAAARFDAAVFTNLSRDHLDYHGTVEAYRASKLRLLDLLKVDGVAAINADDPAWRDLGTTARTITFGIDQPADVRAEGVSSGPEGMRWTMVAPGRSTEVLLPLFGAYNIANALGAAAALIGLGWEMDEIAAGLETVPQVPGRLERVPVPHGGPTVLIDFAHTPDALGRALGAIRPLTRGRVIVVFGAGGDRDRGKRPEMGRVAAAAADLCIVTSDNPRSEEPAAIAAQIEAGMGDAPRRRVLDRAEAIATALDEAGPDDVVLLAGKGHETYQIWGDEKRPFDERRIVAELMHGRTRSQ